MIPDSDLIAPDLPFVDLHRHLDGNVRLRTVVELGAKHGVALPGDTVETLRPHVEVTGVEPDLVSWLARLLWMIRVLGDYDACRRIARENVEDAVAAGLDYVELRFSPYYMARPHGLDPAAVVAAVIAGIDEGTEATGLPIKLIGILSRTHGPEACMIELDALLAHRDRITALDLAGDEAAWPAELFVEHFARGRDAGWRITVHAGEAGGAASVWAAIDRLGATRIGHGVRSIDDPRLMDALAERGIGLELNLTSNLQTSTVPSLVEHPMRSFLERGLLATLNTDNPVVIGSELRHEYESAAPAAGLDRSQIRRAQENALEIAFLSGDERSRLRERVRSASARP
jgi:adenosine deaminase